MLKRPSASNTAARGYLSPAVAATTYPCQYEVVRDGEIVSTGHIILEQPPVVGATIELGGRRLVIDALWPTGSGETRLRLVAP